MKSIINWIKRYIFQIKPTPKTFWNVDEMKRLAGVNEPLEASSLKHIGYLNIFDATKAIIEKSPINVVVKAELEQQLQEWRQNNNIPESIYEGCTYTGNPILVKPKPCDECMPSCLDAVQMSK